MTTRRTAQGAFAQLQALLPFPVASAPTPTMTAAGMTRNVRSDLSLHHLLQANLHLGHVPTAWHPAMNPFIYGTRNGIHIINLDHTLSCLKRALSVTREVAFRGGNVLFLGSRPMLHPIVVQAARVGNAYYATQWKGGLLTNKERVLRRSTGFDPDKVVQESRAASSSTLSADRLVTEDGTEEEEADSLAPPTDNKQQMSPLSASEGSKKQPYVHSPDLIVILDYPNNLWAVREANYAGVPVIALCDTDCDPSKVQYPIPGNDDSVTGLKLIAGVLAQASREGWDKRVAALAQLQKAAQKTKASLSQK